MSSGEISAPVAATRRNRWLAVALLAAVFAGGAIAGILVDRYVLYRQNRLLPVTGARFVAARAIRVLDRELDLTPDQRAKVERILASRREAVESIWRSMQPQVRKELDKTHEEIEAVLTPEQRVKFRELRERWERRARRIFGEM